MSVETATGNSWVMSQTHGLVLLTCQVASVLKATQALTYYQAIAFSFSTNVRGASTWLPLWCAIFQVAVLQL